MSIGSVRSALEGKLNLITPSISTAWQNVPFTPVTGTPYQQVYLLPATPENPTYGDNYHRLIGLLHINLMYPLQAGSNAAEARAELIKTTFKRGTTMTSGSVTVIVERTPDIGQGRPDGDRWMIPVKIRWYAEVFT